VALIVGVIGFMAADGNLDEGIGWWNIINYIMDKIYGLIDFCLTVIAYLETMLFRMLDRQQEFAADEFGGRIGYANALITLFGKFPKEGKINKLSVEYLLYGTHPPTAERIARLQKIDCEIEAKKTQTTVPDEGLKKPITTEKNLLEAFSTEEYLLHPESYSGEELYKVGIFCLGHDKAQEGIEWLERAAENHEPRAYTELGCCYLYGKGVKTDKKTAFHYFKKAFASDEPKGIYMLAECYATLAKTEKDLVTAIKIYGKAAKLGEKHAQAKLGQCFLDGVGVEKNERAAFKWLSKAVEGGDYSIAGYPLAKCYLEGIGVEPNLKKGIFILQKIISCGSDDADRARKLLAEYSKNRSGDKIVMG